MAKFSGVDAFIFKPYFPGIPFPEWDRPVDLEIELVPNFPGIPRPEFEKLKQVEIAQEPQANELGEVGMMDALGVFG